MARSVAMAERGTQGVGSRGGEPVAARSMRLLVVEDSFMAARAMASLLEEWGIEVLGPVATVHDAMDLLNASRCDGAVLDISLEGETSEQIAWRLDRLGVPIIFVSSYQSPRTMLKNENFRNRRLVSKPVEPEELRKALEEEFGRAV